MKDPPFLFIPIYCIEVRPKSQSKAHFKEKNSNNTKKCIRVNKFYTLPHLDTCRQRNKYEKKKRNYTMKYSMMVSYNDSLA